MKETLETLLSGVSSVSSDIEQYSDWAEHNRRLHQDSFSAIVRAKVPRLFLPESLGGLEVDPVTCARVCEEIALIDSAAAWHVMVFNSAKLMASTWPTELVESLWLGNADQLVAASGYVPLTLEATSGGYSVSGTQRFVSGGHFAQFLLSPAVLRGELGMVVVPMDHCEIEDNWHTLGMRGSGSVDVHLGGVEIPALNFIRATDKPVANEHYEGDLYRCPSRIVFATYVPVALALAKKAIGFLSELVEVKISAGSVAKVRDKNVAQTHFGKALAKHRASYALFYEELEKTWARAKEGLTATDSERADLYLAGTHAVQESAEVVRHLESIAATTVTMRSHPLERIHRDIETLRHHGFVNESRYASVAQIYWGAELDYPPLLR